MHKHITWCAYRISSCMMHIKLMCIRMIYILYGVDMYVTCFPLISCCFLKAWLLHQSGYFYTGKIVWYWGQFLRTYTTIHLVKIEGCVVKHQYTHKYHNINISACHSKLVINKSMCIWKPISLEFLIWSAVLLIKFCIVYDQVRINFSCGAVIHVYTALWCCYFLNRHFSEEFIQDLYSNSLP